MFAFTLYNEWVYIISMINIRHVILYWIAPLKVEQKNNWLYNKITKIQ